MSLKIAPGRIPAELNHQNFNFLLAQIKEKLDIYVEQDETSMLSEASDIYFDYDKKSENDKANLMTIQYSYQAIPRLLLLNSNE